MVGVARYLIIYGVRSGIGLRGNALAVVGAVGRVLHLSAIGAASLDEGLGRGVKDESCLRGRSGHGGVGLRYGEGGLLGAAVVTLTGHGSLTCAGVHIVLVGHGVVGLSAQHCLAVLHCHARLLGCAVVDEGLCRERHCERVGIGCHYAPLGSGLSGVVLGVGLSCYGGGVVAHFGGLVAAHLVVGCRHY